MKVLCSLVLLTTLLAACSATALSGELNPNMAALFKVRKTQTQQSLGQLLMSDDASGTGATDPPSTSSNTKSIWDWWFVFQNSDYFIPVVVVVGIVVLGSAICCTIRCCRRRRADANEDVNAHADADANATVLLPLGAAKCGCQGAKGGAAKCGCQGAKGGEMNAAKCGCQGAKGGATKCGCQGLKQSKSMPRLAPLKPIAPMELYATRALTASTAIDASASSFNGLADPQAAVQAIV